MDHPTLDMMLAGATAFAGWAVAVFFWRFWRKTGDRLFVFFSVAFALLGIERLCIGLSRSEAESYFYLIRLAAFLLIIYAIIDKNDRPEGS